MASGGKLFLKGKSINHELTVFSGGVCEAEIFETQQTKVSVTAGGLSYVKASELIDAKSNSRGYHSYTRKTQKASHSKECWRENNRDELKNPAQRRDLEASSGFEPL